MDGKLFFIKNLFEMAIFVISVPQRSDLRLANFVFHFFVTSSLNEATLGTVHSDITLEGGVWSAKRWLLMTRGVGGLANDDIID